MSSPDGTFGASIVDAQGRTWLLGPGGETALHVDGGAASRYCYTGGRVYAQGLAGNPNWYILEPGDRWRGPVPLPIPEPPPPFDLVPRLVAAGAYFALASGERHRLMDATSYMAYKLFLDGQLNPLGAHFEQLAGLGFNCHRSFLMCRNLFELDPRAYGPRFFDSLPDYVAFAASFGLRSNLVVFPDCALVMNNTAEQQAHWLGFGGAVQPVADQVIVSLQNECDQPPNRINSAAFQPIPNVLCSRGSNGSRAAPERDPFRAPDRAGRHGWWAWEEYHTNEEAQWWREPHNAMEFCEGDAEGHIQASHVPMHVSENKKPSRDGVVSHFRDAAECGSLLTWGWCFHADELRSCGLLTGHALACAQAAVEGLNAIPLHCQPGAYSHRKDLERPDAGTTGERAYQRGTEDVCISHSLK